MIGDSHPSSAYRDAWIGGDRHGRAGPNKVKQGLHAVDRALVTVPLRVFGPFWLGTARRGEAGAVYSGMILQRGVISMQKVASITFKEKP